MHLFQLWPTLVLILLTACSDKPNLSDSQLGQGKELAELYCASCHQKPEPELLDKHTWRAYVLPRMGYMMGIYDDSTRRTDMLESKAAEVVARTGLFPKEPILDEADWQAIREYYLQSAPDSFSRIQRPELSTTTDQFKVKVPAFQLSPPSTTLVHFDSISGGLFVGDAHTRALYALDKQGKLAGAAHVREGAVWMAQTANAWQILVMGSFSPTDEPTGFLMRLPTSQSAAPRVLIDKLQRPVHFSRADLNGDGRLDLIICEFGKWSGRLAWWEAMPDGSYKPHSLRDTPGATKAFPHDLDRDGDADIIALFGQGREGVVAFLNQGNGQFESRELIHFPASYGSSSLRLYDWNQDGYMDLLYTAGDNADYPPLYKPYHGIYLYLNRGGLHFEKAWQLPLHGAYGCFPADFDQDGDIDLATHSFFPDFVHGPEEGFVYWENRGNDQFQAATIERVSDGRWLVMDGGDMDGDGDLDLVLGSLAFEVVPPQGLVEQWTENQIPFLILENTLK